MRTISLVGALIAGLALCATGSYSAAPADRTTAERIAQLIAQLGSDRYEEREAATRALDAAGPAALDALRRVVKEDDLEIRRRAEALIVTIEKRMETARLVAARRVHLVYKDTPVTEAVADLAKKTGFPIQLQGDASKLTGRTITLDTGETNFWDAFDQFCRKAGVTEPHLAAAAPSAPLSREAQLRAAQQRQIMMLRSSSRYGAAAPAHDNRLMLSDGKPQELPACQAGAIRFRAVPVSAAAGKQGQPEGETGFTLEVTPEPGMTWQGIVDLRIDRAIDEHGQDLSQAPAQLAADSVWTDDGPVNFIIDNGYDEMPATLTRQTAVRVRAGKKPARMLKEIQGSLAMRVQTPLEPQLTMENILKAGGQVVSNREGDSLKVIAVDRLDNGQVKLRVQVESVLAAPAHLGGRFFRANGAVVIVNGRVVRSSTTDAASSNLALLDAQGRSFPLVGTNSAQTEFNGNGTVRQEYVVTFNPLADKADPSKLVLNGRRTVCIEVPFTLKDVPLP